VNVVRLFILSTIILAHQAVPGISMRRRAMIPTKTLLSEWPSMLPIVDSSMLTMWSVSNSLLALAHER